MEGCLMSCVQEPFVVNYEWKVAGMRFVAEVTLPDKHEIVSKVESQVEQLKKAGGIVSSSLLLNCLFDKQWCVFTPCQ